MQKQANMPNIRQPVIPREHRKAFNFFRLGGDFLHLASIFVLIWKIEKHQDCSGISLKTQMLYTLVFITRYLDIFWNFASFYNWIMKIFFLSSSVYIIYQMMYKYQSSYDKEHDTFLLQYAIGPCFVLALIFNDAFSFSEIMWSFSLFLEAIAILPQLFLLHRTSEVENFTGHYIFTLGGYRGLYLMNWIYRYFTERYYSAWLVWITGLIQTALYCDFFYYYIKSKYYGVKLVLPS